MLIDLLPGADRQKLLETIMAIRGGIHGAMRSYDEYVTWANDAAQKLTGLVTPAEIDRLVLTRRYWLLLSMPEHSQTPTAIRLSNDECLERNRAFESVEADLRAQIARWARQGLFVAPDTSFYIEHPTKLEEFDLAEELNYMRAETVHLLVPIPVVDQLDGLKRSTNRLTRWRAGYTLAVLDRVLKDPTRPGILRPPPEYGGESGWVDLPLGAVTVEILFDRPGHIRLPIDDDEIVDRIVNAQTTANQQVILVTYDTGQAMRARAAGLRTVKLQKSLEDEPT